VSLAGDSPDGWKVEVAGIRLVNPEDELEQKRDANTENAVFTYRDAAFLVVDIDPDRKRSVAGRGLSRLSVRQPVPCCRRVKRGRYGRLVFVEHPTTLSTLDPRGAEPRVTFDYRTVTVGTHPSTVAVRHAR
jgi:hypothetical protein